ncbi:IS5 family transposase [Limnohabitans sp.]|uniref:IS5 family transposase n=1 Tax=Limnohabitans sp. TaxID=1907725 RepID=UPI00286F6997|nr:IS5 family transposase [Limnohabitans sp.]
MNAQKSSQTISNASTRDAASQQSDFFATPISLMIKPTHPLVVLASRMAWDDIEAALKPSLARQAREGRVSVVRDLLGTHDVIISAGVSAAGRPRLNTRLMVSLLYLKHAFNFSDEALVQEWSENIYWQHFSGMRHFEPRLPCDATQVGRFRRALGEAGVEELLAKTVETAVSMKAIPVKSFERVIVDTTVQEKAIAHPTDSRLLDIARAKLVQFAKRNALSIKQTFEREGRQHKRKAAGYAHAKQFKRMHKVIRRQRTIVGKLIRDIERHLALSGDANNTVFASLKERAVRIQTQRKADKNKLYAFHSPEVECISKGKAKTPYEFGVKVSLAVTHKEGLVVGARSFTGAPYDGHTLAEQLEQITILLQNMQNKDHSAIRPTTAVGDLGYRGVKADNPDVQIIQRGWIKSMTKAQKGWLKRRQAIEPVIGHIKDDCRMRRCHLKGQEGDALHAVLCAAGYNIRWLLRAIVNKGIQALAWLSLRPLWLAIKSDWMALVRLISLPAQPSHYVAGNPWTLVA